MEHQIREIVRRIDRWKGAPENGHTEEGYIDLLCAVADDLAALIGLPKDVRQHDIDGMEDI